MYYNSVAQITDTPFSNDPNNFCYVNQDYTLAQIYPNNMSNQNKQYVLTKPDYNKQEESSHTDKQNPQLQTLSQF
jgi:hypothetical protein